VLKEAQRDSLHGMAAMPRREHIDFDFSRRTNVNDASGDSDSVKRYRRFFETHDLHGLPQRDIQTTR
jgi:hypothetical protein